MATEKSICFVLNELPVTSVPKEDWEPEVLTNDNCYERDAIISSACSKGQCNNLALGNLDFKCIPSELISTEIYKCEPRVGDVCIRLMSVVAQGEEFTAIADLYNTYVVKGSSLLARMCINKYAGNNELYIPAMPIHIFVSDWNKSLQQFLDFTRCEQPGHRHSTHKAVAANIVELALRNVPIISDHLWFVVHCIVSRPHLVSQVLQLVGAIASRSGTVYHTGEVENVTVPRHSHSTHLKKLFLIAKPVPVTAGGHLTTALGDHAGVTLGLMWAADEEELHDHLQTGGHCYYVHIGTEAGNTFRCNSSCQWRYCDHQVLTRMSMIGQETISTFETTMLSGNTADSARCLNRD